jgi:hypothetical protein
MVTMSVLGGQRAVALWPPNGTNGTDQRLIVSVSLIPMREGQSPLERVDEHAGYAGGVGIARVAKGQGHQRHLCAMTVATTQLSA